MKTCVCGFQDKYLSDPGINNPVTYKPVKEQFIKSGSFISFELKTKTKTIYFEDEEILICPKCGTLQINMENN